MRRQAMMKPAFVSLEYWWEGAKNSILEHIGTMTWDWTNTTLRFGSRVQMFFYLQISDVLILGSHGHPTVLSWPARLGCTSKQIPFVGKSDKVFAM